jgi:Fis family transcriptional regulator, factor for inversion stimulation protein
VSRDDGRRKSAADEPKSAGVPGPAGAPGRKAAGQQRGATLRAHVEQVLADYFAVLDGAHPCDLYDVVMREVERPLLASVMTYVGRNQSRAADVLGLSRGTLRKKLKDHGII